LTFNHNKDNLNESTTLKCPPLFCLKRYILFKLIPLCNVDISSTDVPLFTVAHSMGGSIVLLASLEEPDLFKGQVLNGPAVEVNPELATPFNLFLARTFASVGKKNPRLSLTNRLLQGIYASAFLPCSRQLVR